VLDAILKQDKTSRVAAETLVKDNLVVLAGEITTHARVNYDEVARNTIKRIGYTDPSIGFDASTCTVLLAYGQQSPNIAQGVDEGKGLDTEEIPDPLAPENLLKQSGRGIFLIRAFMDEVRFRNMEPGTEITLIKKLSGDSRDGKEASQ